MRRRGIEPRPIAWKAIMLTTTPTPLFSGNQDASHLVMQFSKYKFVYGNVGSPSSCTHMLPIRPTFTDHAYHA